MWAIRFPLVSYFPTHLKLQVMILYEHAESQGFVSVIEGMSLWVIVHAD
jgi:hypothetical protein